MLKIILFNIVFLFFAYLYSYKNAKNALTIGFIFHFLFFAIRAKYGNDYDNYLDIYDMFSGMSINEAMSEHYNHFELGWRILCVIFGNLSFQSLIIATQAITSISYYVFIKKCVPRNYALFAVFIYAMTPSYMLLQLSMMREGVAICFSLIAVTLILDKHKYYSLIFAILAFLVHRTAAVFFIVYIFLFFESRFRKHFNLIIGGAAILLFIIAHDIVKEYSVLLFANESFSRYESYLQRTDGLTFGIGNIAEFILWGLPVFLLFNKCESDRDINACQIYLITYLLFPFSALTVLLQRLSIYYSITSICVIPLICSKMDIKTRTLYISLFVLFEVISFISFFYNPIYGKYFIEYHTIFD